MTIVENHTQNVDAEQNVIDVRTISHGLCRTVILQNLHQLADGDVLTIVNDHDPAPLREHLGVAYPDTFAFEYLEEGPNVWRVRIRRLAD